MRALIIAASEFQDALYMNVIVYEYAHVLLRGMCCLGITAH